MAPRSAGSSPGGTAWATVGLHSQALSSPYTVTASGLYYAAILAITGTTMPLLRTMCTPSAARVGITGAAPSGGLVFGSQTAQVDLPNPGTIAAGTAPGLIWIAFS